MRYPFTGYYFVDDKPEHSGALEQRCKASWLFDKIHLQTGDCNELVNSIVQELKRTEGYSLNLAFLDPEGLELHWDTVQKLAGVRRMDLVINYPQSSLTRTMKNFMEVSADTRVDQFFGTRDWRTIYARHREEASPGLHRELIDLYKSRLAQLGYQEVRRGDEVAGDEPLMRSTRQRAPLYRLIFASKSPLGQKFWSAVTKRDVYGQRRLFDSL